jgi:hypothetical protein
MSTRTFLKLAIVAAVAVFTVSCSLDYALDFEITAVTPGMPTASDVTVSYRMTNIGSKDMSNAMIHIRCEAFDGISSYDAFNQWTPGADLVTMEEATGDLVFSYIWPVASAEAWVVSAGTDEGDILD